MTKDEQNARRRARYADNPSPQRAATRAYRLANSETVKLAKRLARVTMTRTEKDERNDKARVQYALKHPAIPLVLVGQLILVAMLAKRYHRRREKQNVAARIRHAKNPEQHNLPARTQYKISTQENPEKMRARGRRLAAIKRSRPHGKMLNLLRTRIWHALKGVTKACKAKELLDMDLAEYRIYLQGQFQPGMTWENYGPVWHIDHVRPCASFDLSDAAQQRECFNWSNTQPLFALDNLRKGDN